MWCCTWSAWRGRLRRCSCTVSQRFPAPDFSAPLTVDLSRGNFSGTYRLQKGVGIERVGKNGAFGVFVAMPLRQGTVTVRLWAGELRHDVTRGALVRHMALSVAVGLLCTWTVLWLL